MPKISPRGMAPALFTRMSAWPTASTTARAVSPLEKSAGWISTGTLCRPRILSRAASSDSFDREAMCTAQPSAAKAMAQAKPMPRLPPVISTVLPESFMSMSVLPFRCHPERSDGALPGMTIFALETVDAVDGGSAIVGLDPAVLHHLDEMRQHRAA